MVRTAELLPYSQMVHRHVITVHNMMQELFAAAGSTDESSSEELRKIEMYFNESNKIFSNVSSKVGTSVATLPGTSSRYRLILNARNYTEMLLQWQTMQLSRIHFLLQNISNQNTSVTQLQPNMLLSVLALFNNSCNLFFNASLNLTWQAVQVESNIALEEERVNFSEYDLAKSALLLMVIQTEMDDFYFLNEASDGGEDATSSTNTVSGSGSGSLDIGSGIQEKILPASSAPALTSLLRILSTNVSELNQQVEQLSDDLQMTSNISVFYKFARALNT